MLRRKSGFTLMEVLVVILIISILATTVGIVVRHLPGRARVAKARTEIGQIRTALEMYCSDQGRFPSQAQGLHALCQKPTVPPVPKDYPESGYLDRSSVPRDPWGNEYVYSAPGRNGRPYEVTSYGRDGEPGGTGEDADISSDDP